MSSGYFDSRSGRAERVSPGARLDGSRPGRIFLLKTGDKFHGTLQLVSARGGVERQIFDAHHQVAVSDGDQKPNQLFVAGGINTEINRLFLEKFVGPGAAASGQDVETAVTHLAVACLSADAVNQLAPDLFRRQQTGALTFEFELVQLEPKLVGLRKHRAIGEEFSPGVFPGR